MSAGDRPQTYPLDRSATGIRWGEYFTKLLGWVVGGDGNQSFNSTPVLLENLTVVHLFRNSRSFAITFTAVRP